MNYYLVDTNVFFHTISSDIFSVAQLCKNKNNDMSITPTILTELEPSFYMEEEDPSSKEIHTYVSNLTGDYLKIIRLVEISQVEGAQKEFKKIRKRYYSWINDSNYLNHLINNGSLSRNEIKNLKKKDLGECELLAIAKASKGEYWVVTNDKGRVYKHPDQNIFSEYEDDEHVTILVGLEWLEKIGHEISVT